MKNFSEKIYIIDGNAYIHRAYHALPKTLTAYSGLPINAVFGFIRMIFKILKTYKPKYLCICLDSEKPTFRHKIFKEYKATRKELEEDIKIQFPIVYDFIKISGLPYLMLEGYEADDLISHIVNKFKHDFQIVIISGDKDILQLVEDNTVVVYNEHKEIIYNEVAVKEKYQVSPKFLVDYFSLIGDKIDNIEGIDGVGPKTASLLINKYGSIEEIYKNIEKLELKLREKFLAKKEKLLENKQLITLPSYIEELKDFDIEKIKLSNIKKENIKEFILKYNMRSLLNELNKIQIFTENIATNKNYDLFENKQDYLIKKEEPQIIYGDTKDNLNVILKNLESHSEVIFSCIYNKKEIIGVIGKTNSSYFYIPLTRHKTLDNKIIEPILINETLNCLNYLFFTSRKIKITFDIKSQLKLLDIKLNKEINKNLYDILLLAYLLNPNRRLKTLQEVVDIYLYSKPIAEFLLPEDVDIYAFPIENLVNRFTTSLEVLGEFFKKYKEEIDKYNLFSVYQNIDLPLITCLIKMEKNGILVDKEYSEKISLEIEERIKNIKNKIYELAGLEFNLNSPKQLSFVLFEKLRLPSIKKKKTGYSTDEEVLNKLYNVHPIIGYLLSYRELEKLKNTYIEPMKEYINPKTQRIHTVFNITTTATGRLSSESPNMQNLPTKTELGRKIRQMFIAEKEFKFVSLDYSQIELRILAHFSEDKNLVSAFLENKDIHKITASEIFKVEEKDVNDELRRVAKTINFGIIYGMTAKGLASELNISLELSEEYIKKYFEKYSKVKEWIDETIKSVKQLGYVKTLFGRVRFIPEIKSSNKQLAAFGERLAVNTPIQGTAADIIKLAMVEIDKFIYKEELENKVKMLLQIHDELLFEIHKDCLEDSIKKIKYIMENVVKLKVPLIAEVKISDRWGE